MINSRILILIITLLTASFSHAQNQDTIDVDYYKSLDSLLYIQEAQQQINEMQIRHKIGLLEDERKIHKDWVRPIVKGTILCFTQANFRKEKNIFQEYHQNTNDYIIAGAPLALTWALKSAGVKSVSSWKRLATANLAAAAIHVGLTKGLKTIVNEKRPNGTDNSSFPSGHTSLAFMSATILSREYGYHSPWITVGGYGCATATQLLRLKHNNHWINDTFIGAGIGIFSANMGYLIANQITDANDIYTPELRRRDLLRLAKQNSSPSGLRYMFGTESGSKTIHADDIVKYQESMANVEIKTSASYTTGLDVSMFLSQWLSVEAMARMSYAHTKVITDNDAEAESFSGEGLTLYHFDIAANASVPHKIYKRIGYKVFAGVRHMSQLNIHNVSSDMTLSQTPALHVPSQTNFEIGTGLTYDILSKKNHAIGFIIDYHHTFSSIMPNRYSAFSTWKIYF